VSTLNLLILACLAYGGFLFLVAFGAERAARRGRAQWMRSSLIYTLSLSIYCTAWTFYGAVGYAARSGLEYLTIYLGPTLVLVGWWWALRKMVRIGRSQRITSVADLVSARFGKSNLLAVVVTILAVVGTTPYIALQLQSVTLSFEAFAMAQNESASGTSAEASAFWVALGLAFFTILFGTRNLDVNERHHGVVIAIALEAVVKLAALLAVGGFVVWGLADGLGDVIARIDASPIGTWQVDGARWSTLIFLSAAAFLCLPRMFQVMVVENADERHLRTASWAFPLYLLLISLFVVPIAVVGLEVLPAGSNPDLFVLTLPLAQGQDGLAVLSFLGGFSSATSMVIVASLALATMVSNHIVMPIWLRATGAGGEAVSGDVRDVVLLARRFSIAAVVMLGYLYYQLSGGGSALAAIGLISFAGIAQVLPVLMGGLFWRAATRVGAFAGLTSGFVIWAYTLFLPSFGADGVFTARMLAEGPYGIGWLQPQALFGISGLDPLVHAVFWSMLLNTSAFILGSLVTFPTPLERLQGAQFVNVYDHSSGPRPWAAGAAQVEDLMIMTQRILGPREAQALFQSEAQHQTGRVPAPGDLPVPTPAFLERLERELSGSVGAATAHAMIAQITGGSSISVQDLMAVADEAAQIIEFSDRLQAQSRELEDTAAELRAANSKLTKLSVQKDAFLSQISHELRTPMTSIRAFAEILRDSGDLGPEATGKYAGIIQDESIRLTRLLDDLLDLSVLENGHVSLNLREGRLGDVLDHAVATAAAGEDGRVIEVACDPGAGQVSLTTDFDRLSQVFINLITNARKYCEAEPPKLEVQVATDAEGVTLNFIDNGIGIAPEAQDLIFEKFARMNTQRAGGAGLGLSICRQIMLRLGGEIRYLPGHGGAHFQVRLPYVLDAA